MTTASLDIRVNSSEVDKGKKSLDDLAQSGAKAEQGVNKTTTATTGLSSAAKVATGVILSLGAAMSVRDVIRYADEWQNASNRLRLVTSSSQDLANVQRILLATANDTRAGFAGTAELFTTLTRSTKDLGLSQTEIINLTKTINQSFAVSGASASAMDGAIRQLAQGLQSGALRGDEFNSIAEQAPGILDAVAASLKMGRGELRDFAATGGITAQVLVEAIQGYADVIDNDFSKAQATFGQSMLIAKNNMLEFVGGSEGVQNAASNAGRIVVGLSENLDELATVAGIATLAIGTQYVAGLAAGTSAMGAATAAATGLRTALLALAGPAGIVGAAAGAMYLLVKSQEASANAAWEQAEAFDAVRAKLGELTINETARAVQAEFEHINALRKKRDGMMEVSDGSAFYEEQVRKLNLELESAESNHGLLVRQLERLRNGWTPATAAVEDNTAATIENITNAEYLTDVYNTQTTAIGITANQYLRLMGVSQDAATVQVAAAADVDAALNLTGRTALALADTNEDATRDMQRQWDMTHDYLASSFVDIFNSGGNAFDNIAKSFERMVQRMVAEWAASGLMKIFGMGGGSSLGSAGSLLGGLLKGGSGGQALSAAQAAALNLPASAAGGGGLLAGAGAAIKGAGSAVSGALGAIPGWGWALAGVAAVASQLDRSTPSYNAGLFLGGSLGQEGEFPVEPFASGVSPVGFTRRAGQDAAMSAIESFRAVDSALVDLAAAAGISVKVSGNQLQGLDERGMGTGRFLGLAGEEGKPGKSMEQQLTDYAKGLVTQIGAQGGLDSDTLNTLLSAGSYMDIINKGKELVYGVDGSHRSGLDYVPFDGYRAVLHQGEEVKSVAKRNSDSQAMSDMLAALQSIQQEIRSSAVFQRRSWEILDQWQGNDFTVVTS